MDKVAFCGEGCPKHNRTWADDETLTVTTHFFFDPEIYIAIVVLGIMATSLLIIAAGLKCFGDLKIFHLMKIFHSFNYFIHIICLILDKKVSRIIERVQAFTNRFNFDDSVIECFGISLIN